MKTNQDNELFDATPFDVESNVNNLVPSHVPKRTVISQLEKGLARRKRNYKRGALLRKVKRQGVSYDISTQTIFHSKQIEGNESVTQLINEYGFIISINKQGAYNLGL